MKIKSNFIILLSIMVFTFFNGCHKKCDNKDACNYDEKGDCINKGKVIFWSGNDVYVNSDIGRYISVTVNGTTEIIVQHYTDAPTSCDAIGCAIFSFCPGSYNYVATSSYDNLNWTGTITIPDNGCVKVLIN